MSTILSILILTACVIAWRSRVKVAQGTVIAEQTPSFNEGSEEELFEEEEDVRSASQQSSRAIKDEAYFTYEDPAIKEDSFETKSSLEIVETETPSVLSNFDLRQAMIFTAVLENPNIN